MVGKCVFYAVKILLTCFFIGMLKPFPGTLGSIIGIMISYFIFTLLGSYTFYTLLFLCVSLIIGVLASDFYSKTIKIPDPKEVILDEIIGQIFSINLLYYFLFWVKCHIPMDQSLFGIIPSLLNCFDTKSIAPYIINFIFFRIFDIKKPFPINYVDRNFKGGFGIMLDDIIAGLFAAIVSFIFLLIYVVILMYYSFP